MVLSERERRLLQEMESHFLAEDPRLASSLRHRRLPAGANVVLAVSGLVGGVLLMVLGIWRAQLLGTAIALVGFSVLVVSTTVSGEWLRARMARNPGARKGPGRARRAS